MKVSWSKRAQTTFWRQVVWYETNRGHDFVESFSQNLQASIKTISHTPSIGRIIKVANGKTYRSFVNHPQCTIY